MNSTLVSIFVCALFVTGTESARILGAFHFNGKSHFIMFEALMKALAAKGHQVVVLSHFPQKNPLPNYTDIDVSGTLPNVLDNITIDTALSWKTLVMVNFIWEHTRESCRKVMDHPKGQALLNSAESFDLVVTEIFGSECIVGFANKFNAPLVHVISSVAHQWAHARIGNPNHPAYIPSYFLPYTSKMDFWQRLTNTMYDVLLNIGNTVYSNNPSNLIMQEYFGKDVPSVQQLIQNASLVLVNSHFSINWPRPAVPAFVEVGGMHIQTPKKLPAVIQKFLDDSPHGVVYFNMGTLVQVQTFPSEKLKAVLDAFGALPEKILMKYTGDSLPGKPENVMVSKWIPQLDVLSLSANIDELKTKITNVIQTVTPDMLTRAWNEFDYRVDVVRAAHGGHIEHLLMYGHPKIKVFISHGGLGGIQETVYAGVPVIGIPLFADQEPNVNNLRELGMATMLRYEDVTKDSLLHAIRTIIDNPSYSENAKKVSALFRDRPMTAMETAVYWVEYVIRHRGAPHLRSAAADMPLYQYLLLDVIAVLLLIMTFCLYISYWAIKAVLRTLTGSKNALQHGKSKRN